MSLLASFDVKLAPLNPGLSLTDDTGVKARGLFYQLVAEADSQLSKAIHEADGAKPFACSALIGRHERGPHGESLLRDGPYRLRFTALSGETADALSATLYRRYATGKPLELGPFAFRVQRVTTASDQEYWARAARYQDLAQCSPRADWRFSFRSPTAFRQRSGHLPLPVPACVFNSALLRWNAHCPEALRMDETLVETAAETVFPSHLEIRSRRVPLEHGSFVGFVGRADFTAVKRLAEEVLCQLTALAEYLYFCGAGHGTPRGWGQVAVLDSPFAPAPRR